MSPLIELERAFRAAWRDARFRRRLAELLSSYAGRPTPLYFAERLTRHAGGARIYLKREDLCHTGAHKINNVLGQALLAVRMGKKRIIAETGAGQHGVASATAAALLGLDVRGVHGRGRRGAPGAQRLPHEPARRQGPSRAERLADAQGRGQRGAARLGHERALDVLRARLGDGPASLSHDGARLPPRDRGGDTRAVEEAHRPAARSAGRLRRRRLQCDGPLLAVHQGPARAHRRRGAGRPRHRERQARRGDRRGRGRGPARQHELSPPERRRAGGRGALDLRRPRLSRRGSRARVLQGPGPFRVRVGHRRRGARGLSDAHAARGDHAGARVRPRGRPCHARRRADEEDRGVVVGLSGRGDKDVHTVGAGACAAANGHGARA